MYVTETTFSKTHFSLLYELLKTEVPKFTQKYDWTKSFPIIAHLSWYPKLGQIKRHVYIRVIIKKNASN